MYFICMLGRMGVLKRLSITPDWMRSVSYTHLYLQRIPGGIWNQPADGSIHALVGIPDAIYWTSREDGDQATDHVPEHRSPGYQR